jgi:general secretion pathway protein D
MTIYEENSSVSGTSSQITNKTSVETNVTVNDGSMIALGGLIKDEYTDSQSGVPLLQSIPLIGNLFKSSGRTRSKSNLMLFLRPIVLRTQSEADALTVNRYDSIRAQQQSVVPDKSLLMRVNDTPLVPQVKSDTQVDTSVPHDPATGSVPLVSPTPLPDMHARPAPTSSTPVAPAPAASAPVPAPGASTSTTTTTTTTTVVPPPAPAP